MNIPEGELHVTLVKQILIQDPQYKNTVTLHNSMSLKTLFLKLHYTLVSCCEADILDLQWAKMP